MCANRACIHLVNALIFDEDYQGLAMEDYLISSIKNLSGLLIFSRTNMSRLVYSEGFISRDCGLPMTKLL